MLQEAYILLYFTYADSLNAEETFIWKMHDLFIFETINKTFQAANI